MEPTAGQLETRGLRKAYANAGAPAVVGFTHRFAPGKITAVLGPSGSGKTTTLAMLAGLVEPDAGQVLLDGVDLSGVPAERRGFGVVFQNYALFPHLSVRENVEFGLRVRGVARTERARRAAEVLETVRIPQLAERRIHQLSGGEQQRVALARALAFRPRVLLMDEPLSALDARLRDDLRADLAHLLGEVGVTTVYVTHDQAEAMSLGDELIVMRAGNIEQTGLPTSLYREPANPFVADFLGLANVFEGEVAAGGLVRLPFTTLAAAPGIPPGPCWVMIRPGDLEIMPPGAGDFQAEVGKVFFLGPSLRIYLRVGTVRLIVDAPGDALVPRDGMLGLRVCPTKLFVRGRT